MLWRQTTSSTSQNATNIVAVAQEHNQLEMSIGLFMVFAPFWLESKFRLVWSESKFIQSAWSLLVGEKLTWWFWIVWWCWFFGMYSGISPTTVSFILYTQIFLNTTNLLLISLSDLQYSPELFHPPLHLRHPVNIKILLLRSTTLQALQTR